MTLDSTGLAELIATLEDELRATREYRRTIQGIDPQEERQAEQDIHDLEWKLILAEDLRKRSDSRQAALF